ncbi:MAG TPA: hypothetical protein VHZ81_11225 [Galbitalea sp.]|jgi:hypothetical protein|nr:hypothetical protein [Galbitalea sp.]
MSRKVLKVAMGLTVVAALTLGVTTVAFAEGQRLSYISAWPTGHRSGTWADSDGDSAHTRVLLTGVTISADNITYTPSSVQLQLLKNNPPFGYQAVSNKTAAPGSYQDWGNPGSGTFVFQYNGSTYAGGFYGSGSGFDLNATHANIYW